MEQVHRFLNNSDWSFLLYYVVPENILLPPPPTEGTFALDPLRQGVVVIPRAPYGISVIVQLARVPPGNNISVKDCFCTMLLCERYFLFLLIQPLSNNLEEFPS